MLDPMDDLIRHAETRDTALRDELAVRHLPLVKFVARKMWSSLPDHIDIDDLVSWGCLGLLDALDKFEPARGHKFSTYAVTRIRGAILDGLQQMDWAPKQITSRIRALRRAREQLTIHLGYEPSIDELAEALQVDESEIRGWVLDDATTHVRSLEPSWTVTSDQNFGNTEFTLSEDADQDIAGEVAEIRSRMAVAVKCLDEREQAVFLLYYRDSKTLRQIAVELGVSVSSATYTHTQLIETVRGRLASLGGVA